MSSNVKLLVLAGALITPALGGAATYNFYFNNTEQGDHGQATPSVTVTDGKVTKRPGEPVKAPPEDAAAPDDAVADEKLPEPAAVARSEAKAEDVAPVEPPSHSRWRLDVAGISLSRKQNFMDANYGDQYSSSVGGFGAMVRLAYQFSPAVDLGVFAGGSSSEFYVPNSPYFYGLELGLTPIRLSLGRIEDLIDIGILVGASSIVAADGNAVSAHGGVKLGVNLGREWALMAALRANLGYKMVEAGVSFRL